MGCGIFGVYKFNGSNWDARPLIKELFIETAVRGKDASGFAYTDGERLCWHKLPMKPAEYAHVMVDQIDPDFRALIGHTRLATHGKPKFNENNHPFISEEFAFALVHNGVIHSQYRGARKPKSDCDTERILLQIEDELAEMEIPNLDDAVFRAGTKLTGGAAVAITSAYGDLSLYRHNNPLFLGLLYGLDVLVFASTRPILENAVNRVFQNQRGVFSPCVVREVPGDHQVLVNGRGEIRFRLMEWGPSWTRPKTFDDNWEQDYEGKADPYYYHLPGTRWPSETKKETTARQRRTRTIESVAGLTPIPDKALLWLRESKLVDLRVDRLSYAKTFHRDLGEDVHKLMEEGKAVREQALTFRIL